jgi:carboxypeptidase PM20D1
MKKIKLLIAVLGAISAGILLVVVVKTLIFTSRQISISTVKHPDIIESVAARRLSQALQLRTVSYEDPGKNEYQNLITLRNNIDSEFPKIRATLNRTIINNYSLLYRWQGTNPALKPVILLAHMDVVPADASQWKHDPFSGSIINGIIWGRGALDDKGSLFAILEAVEHLLESGFIPQRTIYLAFGHDEEAGTLGGMNGACLIAEHLKNEGVHAEFVIDEGSVIISGKLSPVKDQKFAIIGIAEKGFISLKITAAGRSGHSSMPSQDLAIFNLAKALNALEKNKMPSSLNGVIGQSFGYLGPEMPTYMRMLFANKWLFGPAIISILEQKTAMAAMLHTTVAPTIIQGGTKVSALPTSASVIINFRIIPGETSKDVIHHVKSFINDPGIKVEQYGDVVHEPSPISGTSSWSFEKISQTVREIFPDVKVAPGLVTGRTDSLYYRSIADNIYRFAPYQFKSEDLEQVHGLNERIDIKNYIDMIAFYVRFIQNTNSSTILQ